MPGGIVLARSKRNSDEIGGGRLKNVVARFCGSQIYWRNNEVEGKNVRQPSLVPTRRHGNSTKRYAEAKATYPDDGGRRPYDCADLNLYWPIYVGGINSVGEIVSSRGNNQETMCDEAKYERFKSVFPEYEAVRTR